jgi:hypothetical protein
LTDTIGYVATDTWDNTAFIARLWILALHRAMLAQNTAGKPLGDAWLNDQAKGQRRDGVGNNRLGIRRPRIEPTARQCGAERHAPQNTDVSLLSFKEGSSSGGPPDFSRRWHRARPKSIGLKGSLNSLPRPAKAIEKSAWANWG